MLMLSGRNLQLISGNISRQLVDVGEAYASLFRMVARLKLDSSDECATEGMSNQKRSSCADQVLEYY